MGHLEKAIDKIYAVRDYYYDRSAALMVQRATMPDPSWAYYTAVEENGQESRPFANAISEYAVRVTQKCPPTTGIAEGLGTQFHNKTQNHDKVKQSIGQTA